MISRQEILDFSREFGITANIVEKDYVLAWLLAGISTRTELNTTWIFKGGTCLKKCYFETYRFSEDLDFTLTKPEQLNQEFLTKVFRNIAEWINETTGVEIPKDKIYFEVFKNPRGNISVEGKISYKGPLQPGGELPRIKLDLTADEILVLNPVSREAHHSYSDKPSGSIHVQCYCFEELFAEKIRALEERLRPRDLYDVIHLYRHNDMNPNHAMMLDALKKKCEFKGIQVPSLSSITNKPERKELEQEWENMLGHQLPVLPPFEQFWQELPSVFEWIYKTTEKTVQPKISSMNIAIDKTWQPPAMAQAWHMTVPLEIIRFAASNRLCVNLAYNNTSRLIEPYSLRRSCDGNLLLYAVKHQTGDVRSYRVDKIQGAEVTKESFIPRYAIELTASGLVSTPQIHRTTTVHKSNFGPTYIIECSYCGKRFNREKNNTRLSPHKDKSGYSCSGRSGYLVETK
ncbi:MAG: nucleotidyl transferase AbiEii/AbiGii toxin family protein [Elusimicrobiota bacterium]